MYSGIGNAIGGVVNYFGGRGGGGSGGFGVNSNTAIGSGWMPRIGVS
jgi:hypothetical protein